MAGGIEPVLDGLKHLRDASERREGRPGCTYHGILVRIAVAQQVEVVLRAVRPREVAEEVLPRAPQVQPLGAAARGDGARCVAHGAAHGRLGVVGHAADVVALEEDVRHAAPRVAETIAEPPELPGPEAELAQVHGPDAWGAALGRRRRALRVVGRREARRERRGRRVLDVRLVEVRADAERRVVKSARKNGT